MNNFYKQSQFNSKYLSCKLGIIIIPNLLFIAIFQIQDC